MISMRTFLKPLSFIPALLLMYMIFSFSGQSGEVSSQLSFQVSCKIVEAGDYIFDANLEQWQIEEWANKIHFITRKLAHMTEYFALAIAVSFPLYVYGMHGILLMLTAGIICVGFACGDEYHQSFVAGRSPSPKDVAIDSIGVFFGIIVVRVIGWTGRKTIFRPKTKKVKQKKIKQKNGKRPKVTNKNVTYQQGPGNGAAPYPGGYQQTPPYSGQPPYGGGATYQGQPPYPGGANYQGQPPYSGPGPYPDQRPHPNSGPYQQPYPGQPYQGQEPYPGYGSYQGQPSYGPGESPYTEQDMPFSDDPYVNPEYQGAPPYQNAPYPSSGSAPYYQGQPPYSNAPYQDPYQDPNFSVQPPEDEDWMPTDSDGNKKTRKKKKKEKDWFFDM